MSQKLSKLISDLRPQKLQAPRNLKKIYLHCKLVSILISNVLWSCNVQRQQPERIEIFIFPGLSLSHQSNSENLTRFKIAADTLMTFAGEFFTKEIERQSRYSVVQIEVSFVSTR